MDPQEQLSLLSPGDPLWHPAYQPPEPPFDPDTNCYGDWDPDKTW